VYFHFPSDLIVILTIASGVAVGIAVLAFFTIREGERKKRLIRESPTPPPPLGFDSHDCPGCGRPLTFIAQYNRWYCYDCKDYP